MATSSDKYSNILTQAITMSAANTLTFQEVSIGLSLFDKAGILLSRIEYEPVGSAISEMTADADSITLAVTASNTIAALTITQQAVIHRMTLRRSDFGTAASGSYLTLPIVSDFASLPGGGLLITPKPWYVAMDTSGLNSAASGTVRFFFTVMKMTSEQYFELLETRQYFG